METISNIASSASKLIYGDPKAEQSGQEPVSGQTGRGTADEPYDSGNLEGKSAIFVLFCLIRLTSSTPHESFFRQQNIRDWMSCSAVVQDATPSIALCLQSKKSI